MFPASSSATQVKDAAFAELYKKRMLTAGDLCHLATDIGLSDKTKEVKQSGALNVGIRLMNRNDAKTCKRVAIEAKGYSPYGVKQFDAVKAVANGWVPLKPLTDDDKDEKKRKKKGWNCDIDIDTSPDFASLNSVVGTTIHHILSDPNTITRFAGLRYTLESKGWAKDKEDGTYVKLGLNPDITKCMIANSKTKRVRKVEFDDFPKEQPGTYTFKMRWDHYSVTQLETDRQSMKIFNPIFYVQTVIYHEDDVQLEVEDEYQALEGFTFETEIKKRKRESSKTEARQKLPKNTRKLISFIASQQLTLKPPQFRLADILHDFLDEYQTILPSKQGEFTNALGQLYEEYSMTIASQVPEQENVALKQHKERTEEELLRQKRLLQKAALEKLERKKRKHIEPTETKDEKKDGKKVRFATSIKEVHDILDEIVSPEGDDNEPGAKRVRSKRNLSYDNDDV